MKKHVNITIITIPKKFEGKSAVIQFNAVSSWAKISNDIILFGDDEGVRGVAKKFGFRHISKIERNAHGTPILADVFKKARTIAQHSIIAYVNTDVILFDDFPKHVTNVASQLSQFLFIGKRRNIELNQKIDFAKNWQIVLRNKLKQQGRETPVGNSTELFVFPKTIEFAMPPFAIGRLHWDSWLIYRARFLRIPVIDATPSLFYLHHVHDYSHHKKGFKGVWYGDEAQENFVLAGGNATRFKVTDADYILTSNGIKRPEITIRSFIRSLRVFGVINPQLNFIIFPIYLLLLGIFKISMFISVLPRMNSKRIMETLTHPGLLEYKLKEL